MSAPATQMTSIVTCPNCGRRNRVPAVASSIPRCGNCHQALQWVVDAGDDDFTEVVERAPVPVLVDMWATWCGPCRMVSPALERIATDRRGRIKLVKVDVDKAPRLSQVFQIRAVPTLMVWRDGQLLARQPGAAPEPMLRQWLDDALSAGQAGSGDQPGKDDR
ncbi:MAG: thioredoxin [Frankiales bacterium]|nr:thioredoxin [Frankiales bacterium]